MPTLLSNLNDADIKVRWQEPYVSEALNIALATRKRGIHFGFDMVPGGTLNVSLDADPDKGGSMLVYRDSTSVYGISVWRDSSVVLNLAGFAGTTVYIGVVINYTQGVATVGELNAYTQAEYDAGLGDAVVLGCVNVPGAGSIVAGDIDIEVQALLAETIADFAYKEDTYLDPPGEAIGDPRISSTRPLGDVVTLSLTNDANFDIVSNSSGPALSSYRLFKSGATAGDVYLWPGSLFPVRGSSARVGLSYRIETSGFTCSDVGVEIRWYARNKSQVGVSRAGQGILTADTTAFKVVTADIVPPAAARFGQVVVFGEGVDAGDADICAVQAFSNQHGLQTGLGVLPTMDRIKTPHLSILDESLEEGVASWWDWSVADRLETRALGKSLVTWAIGTPFNSINLEVCNDVSVDGDFRYINTQTMLLFQSFRGFGSTLADALVQWLGAVITQQTHSSTTWQVIRLPNIGDTARWILPTIPDQARLIAIRLGVDSGADGDFDSGATGLQLNLTRLNRSTGTQGSVTGGTSPDLGRTSVGTIDQVVWSGINGGAGISTNYSPGGNFGFMTLQVKNNTANQRDIYWVELELEVDRLKNAVNIL